jgi:DNA-binding transcriptional regulator YbjK
MGAPVRRSEPQRRDRIVDVTLDLVEERGVGGVTFRAVAAAADVPLGSMTYHFPSRDDLLFTAFERFANDLFSPLDEVMGELAPGEDPRECLVRMIVSESRDRKRDMVLLAELYVLAIREERYAELMRQWMRRAGQAITRHVRGVSGHVIDAVQEGIGLQRYFLPDEFPEELVRRTLHDVIPDANRTASLTRETR